MRGRGRRVGTGGMDMEGRSRRERRRSEGRCEMVWRNGRSSEYREKHFTIPMGRRLRSRGED